MAEFPALPIWTDALIGDTYHLTPAQFGAYIRLLIVAWRRPKCNLPNDDAFLGRSIGDTRNWHRIKPVVMPFFTLGDDGMYRQFRLLREYDYVSRKQSNARAAGRASALKRLKSGPTVVDNPFQQPPNDSGTPTPTPTPSKKVSKKDIGKHLLPDSWEPLPRHFEHGARKGLSTEEITDAALEMRSWSLGNGEKRPRWDHVFTNWLNRKAERKAKDNGYGRRNGTTQGKSAILDTLDRAIEERRGNRLRAIEGPGNDGLFPEGRGERPGEIPAGLGGDIVGFPKAGD